MDLYVRWAVVLEISAGLCFCVGFCSAFAWLENRIETHDHIDRDLTEAEVVTVTGFFARKSADNENAETLVEKAGAA